MAKERDYTYDAVRGICMFLIPLQHFLDNSGLSAHGTIGGLVYVTVDIFTIPIFFFISGVFSKKPERGREIAFGHILWPAIISFALAAIGGLVEAGMEYSDTGVFKPEIYFPVGMWFMVVLFAYRFFHKNLVKIPYLIGVCFAAYLLSGFTDIFDSNVYGKARIVNYLIAFILGYFMTQEQINKIKCLKVWHMILLGIALIGFSILVVYYMPEEYSLACNLKGSYSSLGITWWQGFLFRIALLLVTAGWFVLLWNLCSNKKGFWAWIGMNTMPIYMFHLMIAKYIEEVGPGLGIIDFGDNIVLKYIWVFVLSAAVAIVLATKPANKLYEWLVDDTYKGFMWFINKAIVPIFGIIQKPFDKILNKLK